MSTRPYQQAMLGVLTHLLFVDPSYQRRATSPTRLRKLRRTWDVNKIGTLVVSARSNGTYAILDGGHRWTVGREKGHAEFRCLVYFGLSLEEEADLFLALNDRLGVSRPDQFKAQLANGNEEAQHLAAIAKRHGLSLGKKGWPHLHCVKACQEAYGLDLGKSLDTALGLIVRTWPDDDYALHQDMVRGVSLMVCKYPDLRPARFIHVLQDLKAREVLVRARQLRLYRPKLRVPDCVRDILVDDYNAHLSKHQLRRDS